MPGLIGEWTPGGGAEGALAGFSAAAGAGGATAATGAGGATAGFGGAVGGGGSVGFGTGVGGTGVGGGAVGCGGVVGATVAAVVGGGGAVGAGASVGFGTAVGAGGAVGAGWVEVGATSGAFATAAVGAGDGPLEGNRPPASRKPTPAATRAIATSIRASAAVRPADDRRAGGAKPPSSRSERSMRSACRLGGSRIWAMQTGVARAAPGCPETYQAGSTRGSCPVNSPGQPRTAPRKWRKSSLGFSAAISGWPPNESLGHIYDEALVLERRGRPHSRRRARN